VCVCVCVCVWRGSERKRACGGRERERACRKRVVVECRRRCDGRRKFLTRRELSLLLSLSLFITRSFNTRSFPVPQVRFPRLALPFRFSGELDAVELALHLKARTLLRAQREHEESFFAPPSSFPPVDVAAGQKRPYFALFATLSASSCLYYPRHVLQSLHQRRARAAVMDRSSKRTRSRGLRRRISSSVVVVVVVVPLFSSLSLPLNSLSLLLSSFHAIPTHSHPPCNSITPSSHSQAKENLSLKPKRRREREKLLLSLRVFDRFLLPAFPSTRCSMPLSG